MDARGALLGKCDPPSPALLEVTVRHHVLKRLQLFGLLVVLSYWSSSSAAAINALGAKGLVHARKHICSTLATSKVLRLEVLQPRRPLTIVAIDK